MRKCSYCEHTTIEDNKFCTQCGNLLVEVTEHHQREGKVILDNKPPELEANDIINERNPNFKNHLPSILLLVSLMVFTFIPDSFFYSLGICIISIIIWKKQVNYQENPNAINLPTSIINWKNKLLLLFHKTEDPSSVKVRSNEVFLLFVASIIFVSFHVFRFLGFAVFAIMVLYYYNSKGKLRKTVLPSIDITKRSKFPLFISYFGFLVIIYGALYEIFGNIFGNIFVYRFGFISDTSTSISILFILGGLFLYIIQNPDQIRDENNISNNSLSIILLLASYSLFIWLGNYLAWTWTTTLILAMGSLLRSPSINNNVFAKVKSELKTHSAKNRDRYRPQSQPINNQFTPRTQINTRSQILSNIGPLSLNQIQQILIAYETSHNTLKNDYASIERNIVKTIPEKIDLIIQEIDTGEHSPTYIHRLYNSLKTNIRLTKEGIIRLNKELDLLKGEVSTNSISKQLEDIEFQIKDIKEKLPFVTQTINNDEMVFKKPRKDLDDTLMLLEEKLNDLKTSLPKIKEIQKPKQLATEVQATKIASRPIKESSIQYNTVSFKLKSLISEKIISNLFAYVGALFITLGFFYGINFTYNNFILKSFPADVERGQAILGTSFIYLFGFVFILSSLFLPKIRDRLTGVSRLISSFGFVILQFAFFVQTNYFVNLNLDANYLIFPGITLVIAGTIIGYIFKSQLISTFAIGLGMYNGLLMGSGLGPSSVSVLQETLFGGVNGPAAIFFFNLILLVFCVLFALRKQIWIPLVVFSLLSPIIWLNLSIQLTIMSPAYLVLFVTITNIILIIAKKFNTPKPFTHFLGILFLIYPNIMAIYYTIDGFSIHSQMSGWEIFHTITVFSSFYVMYWVFVFFEKKIELSFEFPVSFNFSTENLKMRPIQQRLNWLLLTSLVLLYTIVYILKETQNYDPIIYFAILLALMAGIGIRLNFNEYVKNSILLMLLTAEVVFMMSLGNPNASNVVISVSTAIFLVSFLANYQIVNSTRRSINILNYKISPYQVSLFVSIASIVNFLIAAQSEEYGVIVLMLSSVSWIGFTIYSLIIDRKDEINAKIAHAGILSGLSFLFIYGLLRQNTRFPIDFETKSMSTLVHSSVNLTLGSYLLFAVIMILFGGYLKYNSGKEFTFSDKQNFFANARQIIVKNQIYAPHIIIFALPSILIAFGFPYFYYPTMNQAILMIYFMLYFLLLPFLVFVSRFKKNNAFGTLAAFTGYFAFLGGFVLLGGAKKLYDIIVQPPKSNARGVYFIDPAWAIFIIVVIFVVTVAWVIALSNKGLKLNQELIIVEERKTSEATISDVLKETKPNKMEEDK